MDFEMPAPGAEHEKLAQLAGHWIGDETMMPSPWSPTESKRTGIVQARMLEGFFLISEYEQKDGDQVTFRGHGVYSWDPQESCYVMHWFDSMGGAGGIAKGHMEGNQLTFQSSSPMGQHRYRYTMESGEYVFEMAMSQDGQEWQTMMVGRYKPA